MVIASALSEQIDGEIGTWDVTSDIRAALAQTTSIRGDDDVFVVSNESDEDGASLEGDVMSLHTDEYMEPLTLN